MRSLPYIFVICFAVLSACSNQRFSDRLERNANALLNIRDTLEFTSNANNPTVDIVNVGPGLFKVLNSRTMPTNRINIEISDGDLFGEEQGVTHSIKYTVKGSEKRLMLRMRYDNSLDKFHIVGYTGNLE